MCDTWCLCVRVCVCVWCVCVSASACVCMFFVCLNRFCVMCFFRGKPNIHSSRPRILKWRIPCICSFTPRLATLAARIGRTEAAATLRERADAMRGLIEGHLWDEGAAIYTNLLARHIQHVSRLGLCGAHS